MPRNAPSPDGRAAPAAARSPLPEGARLGVIDVGSNTATLVVFEVAAEGHLERIAKYGESLRLLRDLRADRTFPDRAIRRVARVVQAFGREAVRCGAYRVDAIATSAVREARNRARLLAHVRRETGIALRVLSGEDEARAAVRSAVNTLPIEEGFVLDLGGGSAQIARVAGRRTREAVSLPLGTLRLGDAFLRHDPPTGSEVTEARRRIREVLHPLGWFHGHDGLPLVGVGGTIRALARIDRETVGWPVLHSHGYHLRRDRAEAIFETTSRIGIKVRGRIPGLREHRVDVIVPGSLLVADVLRERDFDEMIVSIYGIREGVGVGIVAGSDEDPLLPDVRESGLEGRFPADSKDPRRPRHAQRLARELFRGLARPLGIPASLEEPFAVAARLATVWTRRPPREGREAALLAVPIHGFLQEEILGVAALLLTGHGREPLDARGLANSSPGRIGIEAGARRDLRALLPLALALADATEPGVHVACRPGDGTARLSLAPPAPRVRLPASVLRGFERAFGRGVAIG